ncbi:MAG: translation initiation factor IF-3 [Alphaproteobacteria bacterium]|nr:translation initiation factor IF-3 [Alphaproteobacteria bacterium]
MIFLDGECHIARVNADSPQTREVSRNDGPRVNQEITSPKVRLIDAEGEMLGVVGRAEALALAVQAGLDLVEVSPNAEPPVCKILDYGKFKYEQQKKKAEAKKKQKIIEVKEIQMRPMIDDNDLEIKCRAIKRFLEDGDKVKISMRFRGREMSHQEIGMGILLKVKQDFEELAKFETLPRFEGRQIVMIMAPK